jgi:hypothetical protein
MGCAGAVAGGPMRSHGTPAARILGYGAVMPGNVIHLSRSWGRCPVLERPGHYCVSAGFWTPGNAVALGTVSSGFTYRLFFHWNNLFALLIFLLLFIQRAHL